MDIYRFVRSPILASLVAAGCSKATPPPSPSTEAVATSRSALTTSVPGKGSGILWQQSNGEMFLWDMATPEDAKAFDLGPADLNWQVIGTGDFNNDKNGDVFWHNATTNQLSLWTLNDTSVASMPASPFNCNFCVPFFGDFDGDGVSDILWTYTTMQADPSTGQNFPIFTKVTWLMNSGRTTARSSTQTSSTADRVVAVGNFDGDSGNKSDLLYRAEGSDWGIKVALNGGAQAAPISFAGPEWVVKGVGDFNNDGKSDVLWYDTDTGDIQFWPMDGANSINALSLGAMPASTGWTIVGLGDLDHDGYSDILWRHTSGVFSAWLMNASGVKAAPPVLEASTALTFAGVVDLPIPAVPGNAAVTRIWRPALLNPQTSMWVDFNIPTNRPNDFVMVREPPGTTMPGSGAFPMKLPYHQISAGRGRITIDNTTIFGGNDHAALQIAQWEQGRQSAFTATIHALGAPQPPPTPTGMTILRTPAGNIFWGCSAANGGNAQTCYKASYQDNDAVKNPASGCELWYATGLGTLIWHFAPGSCGNLSAGIQTVEKNVHDVGNDPQTCFQVREYNDGGYSQFSNIACTGTSPPPPPANLVLGNGVIMCDFSEANCNFMPQLDQSFLLTWAVCNVGGVPSAAGTVTLVTQTGNPTVTTQKMFPFNSVPAGQCVQQKSAAMSVPTASDWHWDVDINGNIAGGTDWSFF
jgi:FG-GAP-like repeat